MATWKSPIFSDIRNKLGENVVFSMWKGRPYMRSYVKPSNPKSLAQTANRLHMKYLVGVWQTQIASIEPVKKMWNAAGLSDLISGYNRFTKGARGYVISAVNLSAASFSLTVDSCALPLNEMKLYVLTTSATVKAATKQTLGTYTSSDFDGWSPASGDKIYLIDLKALGTGTITSVDIDPYGSILQKVDETAGTITPVKLTL